MFMMGRGSQPAELAPAGEPFRAGTQSPEERGRGSYREPLGSHTPRLGASGAGPTPFGGIKYTYCQYASKYVAKS